MMMFLKMYCPNKVNLKGSSTKQRSGKKNTGVNVNSICKSANCSVVRELLIRSEMPTKDYHRARSKME